METARCELCGHSGEYRVEIVDSGFIDNTGHDSVRCECKDTRACYNRQKDNLKCHEIRQIKRYAALPQEEWDEKGMLYSEAAGNYFSSWDEVEEYLEEDTAEDDEKTIEGLRLIICEPNYLPLITDDYGYDELVEDGELPDDVIQAIEDFNKAIKAAGPVSWSPGKKAAVIMERK